MSHTVFFNISPQMAEEIKDLMNKEGYTNKAEFFRFLVKFFKYNRFQETTELQKSVDDLEETLITLDKKGILNQWPSAEEQLADV